MPTRRDIVKLALSTSAWLLGASLGCRGRQRAVASATESVPRYWIQLLLSGGHDTVFTTDPKLPRDVDSFVTLPTNHHITEAGELQLGPHFAPLAAWSKKLTVLNGVQVRTANHDTGDKQFFHLKTNINDNRPTALDIIASHRQGQPLGAVYLNMAGRSMHSPSYFGTADQFYFGKGDVFDDVAQLSPTELVELARVLRQQRGAIGSSSRGRAVDQTAAYLGEVADFFEKVAKVPPLVSEQRSIDYVAQTMATAFDRALWLIEHDLCCGVVIDLGLLGWDTHIHNEPKQAEMSGYFTAYFGDYLAELHTRFNSHGLLADNTVTVVGSELGRFPRQNDMLGKDHLPQTSFMFTGPGIRLGKTFGKTGRLMEGLPISYHNGDPADAGRVPVLDDLGATLLHLAGLDPERYGYDGRVCSFLLDGIS